MEDEIKVLYFYPHRNPEYRIIPNTLKAKQKLVRGLIEAVYPWDDPVALVCNEEGKINGMELNRVIEDEDGNPVEVIAGPFFICGIGEEDFESIGEELGKKYYDLFFDWDVFFRDSKGHICYRHRLDFEGKPKRIT